MEEKIVDKETKKVKFGSKEWLEDFFIPRNIIDVVFIVVCFCLTWYALTYDIPNAKVPVICANYWNKWANEKAGYLGGMYTFNNTSFIPTTSSVINMTTISIDTILNSSSQSDNSSPK